MKIEYTRKNGIDFRLIVSGDCFLFKDKIFMRVEPLDKIDYEGNEIEYNAIDLEDGSWIGITDFETVIPVDGKIVIAP